MAAMQVLIAGIIGVDGHGGIAQHGFGAGGGQLQHFAGFLYGVQKMPEVAVLFLMLHLGVGNRGVAVGAPVHHRVAAIDAALFVQAHKHFLHGIAAAIVHGKALTLPVAAGAQLFQLADDTVAVFVFPVPGTLQKAIAAQHFFGQAFLAHGLHHFCLGSNGCMVGAGHPQGGIALHTLAADQNILQSVVHGMAHVQLAGNIGRGHYDGIRLFAAVDLRVKIAALAPEFVNTIFHLRGIVLLCELLHSFLLAVCGAK